jgi:hypothetical protein
MGRAALNIRDKPDAAGIVFVFLPVHTPRRDTVCSGGALVSPFLLIAHDGSSLFRSFRGNCPKAAGQVCSFTQTVL